MADQILQARDGATTADLGVTNSQGNINLATHDEDANITLDGALTVLNSILTELGQKLESGGTVALDTATLNALESITAAVSNFPSDYPDGTAQNRLQSILTALQGTLTVVQSADVALDTATLAALEQVTATVDNFPSEYPLPASQISDLKTVSVSNLVDVVVSGGVQTDGLTDSELRASPVEVTGTVNVSGGSTGLTDSELRAQDVAVTLDGEQVNVSGGNISVTNLPSTYPNQHDQPLTDTQLRASAISVDDGHPDPQTDALTDSELRALPVNVNTGLNQPLEDGGNVSVTNLPSDYALPASQVSDLKNVTIIDLPEVTISGGVQIDNLPSEYPDSTQQGYLENRYGGGKTAYAGVLNTSGDNTVITPSAGNAIEVYWVSFVPDPDNASNPVVTVKIGSTPIYTGYAMAHWEKFVGGTDESVVVNLESNNSVAVTIHYKEI